MKRPTHDGFGNRDYARVGIGPEAADAWRLRDIDPIDAAWWCKAGVEDPLEAGRWTAAGVRPDNLRDLLTAGITLAMASEWRAFGADPTTMLKEHKAGRGPVDYQPPPSSDLVTRAVAFRSSSFVRGRYRGMTKMRGLRAEAVARSLEQNDADLAAFHQQSGGSHTFSYLALGWTAPDALPWARLGIDALDAKDWIALGISASDAARSERLGVGPTDVALMWWRAGIPPAEVGDWLGAGLTPDEAAEQRAKGITAEQAAVLRSLRGDEPA